MIMKQFAIEFHNQGVVTHYGILVKEEQALAILKQLSSEGYHVSLVYDNFPGNPNPEDFESRRFKGLIK